MKFEDILKKINESDNTRPKNYDWLKIGLSDADNPTAPSDVVSLPYDLAIGTMNEATTKPSDTDAWRTVIQEKNNLLNALKEAYDSIPEGELREVPLKVFLYKAPQPKEQTPVQAREFEIAI